MENTNLARDLLDNQEGSESGSLPELLSIVFREEEWSHAHILKFYQELEWLNDSLSPEGEPSIYTRRVRSISELQPLFYFFFVADPSGWRRRLLGRLLAASLLAVTITLSRSKCTCTRRIRSVRGSGKEN